jgi:CDP-glucose 4,6-dehydratase
MLRGRCGNEFLAWSSCLFNGHTGFKGSWLSLWLEQLGAGVSGVALDTSTDPSIFKEARVVQGIRSEIAGIRDRERARAILREHRPEVVFHMTVQPLVRMSYEDPVGTFATSVMGPVAKRTGPATR